MEPWKVHSLILLVLRLKVTGKGQIYLINNFNSISVEKQKGTIGRRISWKKKHQLCSKIKLEMQVANVDEYRMGVMVWASLCSEDQ